MAAPAVAPTDQKIDDYSSKQVVFVTGANKGIGLELCKYLVKQNNFHVILGCRNFAYVPIPKDKNNKKDPDNYEAINNNAAKKTRLEILRDIRFKDVPNIDFVEIDIINKDSVQNAVAKIKNKYKNIDILCNNAGMAFKGNAFDINVVNTTLNTNYYGTINVTTAMLPLIKNGGKIIMTSSSAGTISRVITDKNIETKLLDDNLTKDYLETVLKQFKDEVTKDKTLKNTGFKQSAYGMSKVAMSAYSRILAKELNNRNIFVAAYCPGGCKTSMSSGGGNRSPANGAKGLELLCLKTDQLKAQTGKFWGVKFTDNTFDDNTATLENKAWT